MNIDVYITNINAYKEGLADVLEKKFKITSEDALKIVIYQIEKHLSQLNESCYLVIEAPYVDKVFRNSYYHYFSTKLGNYNKDCIKVSIFDKEITELDFRKKDRYQHLSDSFKGFFVIRPTIPQVFGRSIIDPSILKENNFYTCYCQIPTTVNSIKLKVKGFPHSSQDTETISCAETTIWAIMEYFSHRYAEYQPVLPYKIINILNKVSTERQVPSRGLAMPQISYALREFGFGTIVYSKDKYEDKFENILSCYIESGIPVIVGIQNQEPSYIGHALICVGHEFIEPAMIEELEPTEIAIQSLDRKLKEKNIIIYDNDDIEKKFVFVDDNQPTYQKAFLWKPAANYAATDWQRCRITSFIVPLYPKIYLEAYEAKNFVITFLANSFVALSDNSEITLKLYLTSSRSYKDYLCSNESFDENIRDIILETSMPKFIWIAELSNKQLFVENKSNGLIILDATEPNKFDNKPLIISAFQGKLVKFSTDSCVYQAFDIDLPYFTNFNNF